MKNRMHFPRPPIMVYRGGDRFWVWRDTDRRVLGVCEAKRRTLAG